MNYVATIGNREVKITVEEVGVARYMVRGDEKEYLVDAHQVQGSVWSILYGTNSFEVDVQRKGDDYEVLIGGDCHKFTLMNEQLKALSRAGGKAAAGEAVVISPMPGEGVKLLVNEGGGGERDQGAGGRWEKKVLAPVIAKSPERRKRFESASGETIERLYTPLDLENIDSLADAGFPGEYPFTRGVQPTMYRGRFWTMRQYAGFGDARESNRRYRYLLDQGQTGLSVAFDLPTQMGYDSDNPVASGEVGKVGVAIDSIEDMGVLFDKIPLGKVSTSMTINSTASILLAMYIAVGEKQGIAPAALNGTIQNDILKEYIARGTYIYPPAPSMRIITDIFAFCKHRVPKWNTISISGDHIREAGSTAAPESAFTRANGS